MKKEGSILIEVIAAICIITITITVGINSYVISCNDLKKRMLEEEIDMCIYNLSNEIKFNLSCKDIEKLLDNKNEISFKYDENFSRKLTECQINDLKKGEDIKLIMKNDSSNKKEFEIEACITNGKNRIERSYEFSKSWWMDEI